MKTLVISHFFPPETGAGAVRMKYFVSALKDLPGSVRVLNPVPNYPGGKQWGGTKRLYFNDKQNGVTYLPVYVPEKDSVVKRLVSYLSYFFSSFFYAVLFAGKVDTVIASSPPLFTALSACLACKVKRAMFVLDLRDIWPDIGIELGILKNKMFINWLGKIESYLLRNADSIIVTAEGDKVNLLNKSVPEEKISVIYNGADTSMFKPANPEEIEESRKKYGLPEGKKLLVYFGSFNSGMNDIPLLSSVLSQLADEGHDFHFVGAGSGNSIESFLEEIKGKVSFTHFPSLGSEDIASLVAASDISLVPRKVLRTDTGGNIPVKCFESWACGLPVVLSTIENCEVARIFDECGTGLRVQPDNPEEFKKAIVLLLQNEPVGNNREETHKFVACNFSRDTQSRKFADDIKQLLSISS